MPVGSGDADEVTQLVCLDRPLVSVRVREESSLMITKAGMPSLQDCTTAKKQWRKSVASESGGA